MADHRKQLKKAYKKYLKLRGGYSCGHHIAAYINPEVELQWRICEELLAKCKEEYNEYKGKKEATE